MAMKRLEGTAQSISGTGHKKKRPIKSRSKTKFQSQKIEPSLSISHTEIDRPSRKRNFLQISMASLILVLTILSNTLFTYADIAHFYSPLCLGGWKYPQNVEGPPQLSRDSDNSGFNSQNSAILENTNAQIFCGKFTSDDMPDKEIKKLRLSLSLAIVSKYSPIESSNFETGGTLDARPEDGGTFLLPASILNFPQPKSSEIEDKRDEPTPTPIPKPAKKEDKTEEPRLPETLDPATDASQEIIDNIQPSAPPSPEPQPAPQPTPPLQIEESTPTVVPVELPPPAVAPEVPSAPPPPVEQSAPESPSTFNFFKKLIPIAHAQEQINSSADNNILEIKYTYDGENWEKLGIINSNNTDKYFEIPLVSRDQINNLQITVSSLPNLDNASIIYLDSIWLDAEYDSDVVSFIQDIGQNIFDVLTLADLRDGNEKTAMATPTPLLEIEASPSKTPEIKKKEISYDFDVESGSTEASSELNWYPKDELGNLNNLKDKTNITTDKNNLRVSGTCKEKYYVVMIYKNKDDYSTKPSSALYNSAYPCQNGQFQQTITEVQNIDSGTYYLLIAEQGDGPWIPISELREIKISKIEKYK